MFISLAKTLPYKASLSSNTTLHFSPVHCSFVHLNAVSFCGYLSDHCSNVAAPTTGPLLASETNFTVTVEVCRVQGEGKKTSIPYCSQRVLNSLSPLLSLLSESSVCKNRKCIYVSYLPFSLHSSNAVLLLSSDWAKTPSICNISHCTAPTTFTLDCQVILQNSALRHFTNKYPMKQC